MLTLLLAALAAPPTSVPTPPGTNPAPDLMAAGPADAKHPLPQNKALAADRVKRRTDWVRKQWLADFDRTADKAAPGHAEARAAIEAAAAFEGRANLRHADDADARNRALRAAAKIGSPDPLFWVQHTRYLAADIGDDRMTIVAEQLQNQTLSPYVRAMTCRQAAADAHANLKLNDRDDHLAKFLLALGDLARVTDPPAAELTDEIVTDALSDPALGATPGDRYTKLRPIVEAAGIPARVRSLAAGTAWALAAWEARDEGTPELVPDEKKAEFKAALAKAETHLTAAWTADPAQAEAATRMIGICRGRGHPREQMETWFTRAITADPDGYPACRAKLDYLWAVAKGKPDDLLAFGRQCVRGGRPEGWVPEILSDAHWLAKGKVGASYWKKAGVWADLRAVYEPAATALPTDRQVRTRYAQACLRCGHPEAADGHLKAVNNKVWVADFADRERAAELRPAIDRAVAKSRTDDE